MSLTAKPFLFYMVETPTGLAWYRDAQGNIQQAPISFGMGDSGVDISINDPNGWMNSTLGFMRNAQLYGMNRSYSVPEELVNDAAYIFRNRVNTGRGIQEPLTMIIFQYNASPLPGEPTYKFYYKGVLDVPNFVNTVGEGVQVNMIEGGFQQLYKSAENTMIEIPCDGSIPENIRVNLDGMLVPDTMHFNITPMTGIFPGDNPLGMTFISEDGDSYGVVRNDQQYEQAGGVSYYQTSSNFALSYAQATAVTMTGSITVRPFNTNNPAKFGLFGATSFSQSVGVDGLSHSINLIPGDPANVGATYELVQETTFNFNQTINLAANENLFLMWFNEFSAHNITIVGGNIDFAFNTMPPATKVWTITWYDLFRLLVKAICTTYSINGVIYNYDFQSTLLQNNLNLVITSGDALRAAGDPNYQKFYNSLQTNPNFPNINLFYSYGPVIKTTIAQCFQAVNAILNASMSTQILPGQNESVFVEKKGYVFDASVTNLDNGEVTDLKTQPATDLYFTLFKIGWEPQISDQKAGKWSWSTTAEYQTPINTIASKTFELICPYITDPFIIQRLISNIDDTSYTRNSSDNSVFLINSDPSTQVADGETVSFLSDNVFPLNPDSTGNTNLKMTVNERLQPISCPTVNGSYFSYGSQSAIFLFNQPTLAAHSMELQLSSTGGDLLGYPANALNGTPADSCTITLWINGVAQQSWTTTATTASTPINIAYTFTRNWTFKDSIYLTCSTSANGTVQSLGLQLTVNDSGTPHYLDATGSAITVQPGSANTLIALPTVGSRLDGNNLPSISTGFQYFQFNTFIGANESNFNVDMDISGYIRGGTSDIGAWDVYVNGQVVHSHTWASTAAVSAIGDTYSFNQSFQLGDLIWIAGSATNTSVWFSQVDIDFTSTQIFARDLLRVQYDAISGIPTLLGNLPGTDTPITTGAGAPFNLQQMTTGQLVMVHGNYLRSIFYDQIPGYLSFATMSKNEFLSITYKGVTYQDNANVSISSFDAPLFYPRWITYKTKVQETYAEVLTGAYNAHAVSTYNMVPLYGFPWDLKQKPALNEMQDWKLLSSPLNDLNVLDNLSITGVNFINMSPNSIWCSILSSFQWTPEGSVLPKKYHTWPRNSTLYKNQVANWINQTGYSQPVQVGDPAPIQLYTRDLSQVTVTLYDCAGNAVQTVNLVNTPSPAVVAPIFLWEGSIDTTSLAPGPYYMIAVGGNGSITASLISEALNVQVNWPKTILLEYTHSSNKESLIFDTGFSGAMRVFGFFDNRAKQKFKAAFYTDTRQSSTALNSFRYETSELWIGFNDGTPDYVIDKLTGILLCDGCMNEGQGYGIDENSADWEAARQNGNPKSYQKIEIRLTNRLDGVGATATGADTDTSMLITLDAGAFAPNAGNVGGTDPDIIQVQINS